MSKLTPKPSPSASVREVFVDPPVAVVVEPVADLGRARIDAVVGVVAVVGGGDEVRGRVTACTRYARVPVTVSVRVGVEDLREVFVDPPVAVVVEPVAALGRARMDRRRAVVTVGPAAGRRRDAVSVLITASRVDSARVGSDVRAASAA